tara:strand:- start:7394 stop:8419 length:1026 start_codon:yes stop_codon:yes gene_type:complete
MLLLDSLYINNSGGKVLLDYLVYKLEEAKVEVYYLFDERCKKDFGEIPSNRKNFLKATLWNRYRFYKLKKASFHTVLCFGNLAPPFKLNARVFTYFHQRLFLNIPDTIDFKTRLLIKIKISIFTLFSQNSNEWMVQSNAMKEKLALKIGIDHEKVHVLPFYPPLSGEKQNCTKVPNSFIYISNGSFHKNHKRLLEAFCLFYDKKKEGSLTLTIGNEFQELYSIVQSKIDLGYPIRNIGRVDREVLNEYYNSHEYLIFPSLSESFGLGLVEAMECGCKVIGSDLPYTYAVCEPSIVFNPYNIYSMVAALENAVQGNVKPTKQVLFNEIDSIIKLLQHNENKK